MQRGPVPGLTAWIAARLSPSQAATAALLVPPGAINITPGPTQHAFRVHPPAPCRGSSCSATAGASGAAGACRRARRGRPGCGRRLCRGHAGSGRPGSGALRSGW
eukprot:359644-Chlamydomonas_euryale.AAC.1